jgi:putative thioredoxin
MIDVGVAGFEAEVIERSRLGPVVVDFWAPWCGPCRTLGPVLEELERQSDGAWTLAKVNTDDAPALGQRFRIEGIPAVKAFVNGEVVAEFVGAQPEAKVRAWLAALVPAPAERALAAALQAQAAGDSAGADELFGEVLQLDPRNPVAVLRLAAAARDAAEAFAALDRLRPSDRVRHAAAVARVELSYVGAVDPLASGTAADGWRAAGAAVTVALGHGESAAWTASAELLLSFVTSHRGFTAPGYGADAGRKALLSVFDLLGAQDPVSRSFRRRLALELYS